MHECPECRGMCDCDGEDHGGEAPDDCAHACAGPSEEDDELSYTHYYYRKSQTLDAERFAQFVADCRRVYQRAAIPLAGEDGTGEPCFTPEKVCFNGVEACGHQQRVVAIMGPADQGGHLLARRTCDGSCAKQAFLVQLHYQPDPRLPLKPGEPLFACCKTEYRPYDVLVTASLLILHHYFPEEITIASDGESHSWDAARYLCEHVLGYGADFRLHEEEDAC